MQHPYLLDTSFLEFDNRPSSCCLLTASAARLSCCCFMSPAGFCTQAIHTPVAAKWQSHTHESYYRTPLQYYS